MTTVVPLPPPNHRLSYESGKALLANGSSALLDHVTAKIEVSLGRPLPRVEVRFQNLSLAAEVTDAGHADNASAASELPTLPNELKKAFNRFGAKKQVVRKTILKDFTGAFRPGTMTLVLGQAGSGKSALLKILSGRFPITKDIKVDGEITYNGVKRDELLGKLPRLMAYVTQRDYHYPTLSVRETLEFAHACCGGQLAVILRNQLTRGTDTENKEALEAINALVRHFPEIVIEYLGLTNCQQTQVGNAMLRGVSGGERKRVTTGEMEFGRTYASFMDEISTGLDSAATYDIMCTQRNVAKKLHKTIVISLLQPPPQVVDLFDDIILLNEGEVMYHGPVDRVIKYFERLGFRRPLHRDVADFLMDLGTDMQSQYEVETSNTSSAHPRSASEFAEAFRRSEIYIDMVKRLNEPLNASMIYDAQFIKEKNEFHQSRFKSICMLFARQRKILLRNKPFLVGRTVTVIVMGLLYASVYYQFDPTNIQVVTGVIFAGTIFITLGQATQIASFMDDRQIFYKQRAANFYRTSSFVFANSVSRIPLGILETAVFGSLVYWICGFVNDFQAFIVFEALWFLTHVTFGSFFFFLTAVSPDIHIAKPLAMVTALFFILSAGYIISSDNMPGYFIWVYWINPIAWVFRGMAVNEYMNDAINKEDHNGIPYKKLFGKPMGEFYLSLFGIPANKRWAVYGILFVSGFYLFFLFMAYLTLEYLRYDHADNLGGSKKKSAPTKHDALVPIAKPEEPQAKKYFVPVTLAFEDLWYSVPMPGKHNEYKDLLKGISGYARPGTMTALMGSSGAGKTTLMDVIAGRKTGGKIRGRILLNGYEATDLAIRRATGYCEQMDIHSDAATFREAFTFSAFLRQDSSVPDSVKYESVEECLDLLALGPIADKIIRGSSVEQMKRLTIGVELAAQPSVLFLDEPTSGLDARSAKLIMDGVRKVANTGRTVVCTIHQPSTEVFNVFDNLLLLRRGGETVFFGELGEHSSKLVAYFSSIPDVGKLAEGYNPATWMLEVIGAGVGNANADGKDFVKIFKESENFKSLTAMMDKDGVTRPAANTPALTFTHARAASEMTQFRFLMLRFWRMYWRTASYNLTRFFIMIFLGILFGVVYLDAEYDTFSGINSGVGMIFMTTAFLGIVCLYSVLPVAIEDRPAFYRERASQTYSAWWYFVTSTLVEIPYVFASCLVFTAIFFPMVGFRGAGNFVLYWVDFALLVLFQTYFGQLLAFCTPSMEVGAALGVLVNSMCFLFMGFNPPAHSIPKGYKWLYQLIPQRFTLSFLVSLMFGNCADDEQVGSKNSTLFGCQLMKDGPAGLLHQSIKAYVEQVFNMQHDHMWRDFGVSLAFLLGFRVAAYLAMRFLCFQKR